MRIFFDALTMDFSAYEIMVFALFYAALGGALLSRPGLVKLAGVFFIAFGAGMLFVGLSA